MFLIKLLHPKKNFLKIVNTFYLIEKINKNIALLFSLKRRKKIQSINFFLFSLFLKKSNLLEVKTRYKLLQHLKTNSYYKKSFKRQKNKPPKYRYYKKSYVTHILNINLTNTNTLINITDIKGNVLLSYSSGFFQLKGKQKIKQPGALITVLKQLICYAQSLKKASLAVHFKNVRSNYESFVISILKQKFFIKTVRSYNFQPHNGCRPKKLKRIKGRKY